MSNSISKPNVLVTSASGNAGHCVARKLSESGCFNVRAGVRHASEVFDLPDFSTVVRYDASIISDELMLAMKSIDYLFLVPPSTASRMIQVKNYIKAAKDNDVNFILLFTMMRPKTRVGQSIKRYHQEYDAIEAIIETSGIPYAFIRGTLQFQTLFLFVPDIWRNALPLPWGNGRIAMLDINDLALAVREILKQPHMHEKRCYHLTGKELLSVHDIANIATTALNVKVQHVNITRAECFKLLLDSGLEEWLAEEFLEIFEEIESGCFDNVDNHELLEAFTGTRARSLLDFFLDHAVRFKNYTPGMSPPYGPPEGVSYVSKDATTTHIDKTQEPYEFVNEYGQQPSYHNQSEETAQQPQGAPETTQVTEPQPLKLSHDQILQRAIKDKEGLIQRLLELISMEEKSLSELQLDLSKIKI